jgi:hypothetical protein
MKSFFRRKSGFPKKRVLTEIMVSLRPVFNNDKYEALTKRPKKYASLLSSEDANRYGFRKRCAF